MSELRNKLDEVSSLNLTWSKLWQKSCKILYNAVSRVLSRIWTNSLTKTYRFTIGAHKLQAYWTQWCLFSPQSRWLIRPLCMHQYTINRLKWDCEKPCVYIETNIFSVIPYWVWWPHKPVDHKILKCLFVTNKIRSSKFTLDNQKPTFVPQSQIFFQKC